MDFRLRAPSLSKLGREFLKERKGKIAMVFFFSILPLITVCVYWIYAIYGLIQAEQDLDILRIKAAKSTRDKYVWETYVRHYGKPNPYYFEESIEPISFLSEEKKKLSALLEGGMFSNHDELQKRYRFITSGENVLRFSEERVFESNQWRESKLLQLKPIEIEGEDFPVILEKIEGHAVGKPQCIVTSCTLEGNGGGVTLSMECLKRELLKQ